jgi:hypothetical protein
VGEGKWERAKWERAKWERAKWERAKWELASDKARARGGLQRRMGCAG